MATFHLEQMMIQLLSPFGEAAEQMPMVCSSTKLVELPQEAEEVEILRFNLLASSTSGGPSVDGSL